MLALPPLGLVVLVIAALASPDRLAYLARLLDPSVIATLFVVELVVLGWRLVASADAFRRGEGRVGGRASALSALGVALVLVPSVYAAYLTQVAYESAASIFSAVETPRPSGPTATPEPDPSNIAMETGSPAPSIAPGSGRFTVLFIGVDWQPGRNTFLTDTMIVGSLDPVSNAVSMVSMPRDTVDVPLGDGRVFRGKINSLVAYVRNHPKQFPDAPSGETVLANALGTLLGVKVDGWVEVNMPGFIDVVDSLRGINVTVDDGFCDPTYHGPGFPDGFSITVGRWHLDGEEALAYARVRKASGESDFTRAARQQEVVVAIRDRVVSGGFVNDPVRFIRSFRNLVRTSLAPARLIPFVDTLSKITRDHVFRAVITYPLVHYQAGDPRGWVIVPRLDKIRELGARAFPTAGTLPTGLDTIPPDDGAPKKGSPTSCAPAPKPTPKPTPTPAPTLAPSVEPTAAPTAEPTVESTPAPSAAPTPDASA